MEKEDYLNDAFAVLNVVWMSLKPLLKKLGWHKMVESYSKNANHNMRRPVVKEEIVDLDAPASKASHRFFERIGRLCP